MNSRIEPNAGTGQDDDRARVDALATAVQMISASPLTLLIGPRGAATSQFARAAAIACAGLRESPVDGKCGDVVVIFDQWSGDPLLALGEAIAAAVSRASGLRIVRRHSDHRTLDALLSQWAERFDADFFIVLDRYEQNLAAEPLNGHNARFAEQLAESIAHAAAHIRFLVVVSDQSEAAVSRLTARLASPCSSVVRLGGAPAMPEETDSSARPAQAVAAPAREPAEPLPGGTSALADDRFDTALSEAIRQRRQRRRAIARWGYVGMGAALLIAVAAGIALFIRSQAAEPDARLAQALDLQPVPIVPAPAAVEPLPAVAPPLPVSPVATSVPASASISTISPPVDSAPPAMPRREPLPQPLRIDALPGPPVPAKLVRRIANPEKEPMLFIHIRSESQRAQARILASGLARLNIVVSGIRVEQSGPPRGDLRYYRSGERDEANYLARSLGRLGAPALRIAQVAGHEAAAVPRHYELWLPPTPTR